LFEGKKKYRGRGETTEEKERAGRNNDAPPQKRKRS